MIHMPPVNEPASEAVPDRLARLMVQQQTKPPPPVVRPKPEVKPEPKPVPHAVVPTPVDRTVQALHKAQNSGIMKFQDELADIRRDMDPASLGQTRNLQGAVGADAHAERSLIASNASAGSGAVVTTASASGGFGTGAGALTGHQTERVSSRIAQAATAEHIDRAAAAAPRARRRRSRCGSIATRARFYALYERVLRQQPDLQGKLVLEFTISPDGEVTECHVLSSELHDPDLERMIVVTGKAVPI